MRNNHLSRKHLSRELVHRVCVRVAPRMMWWVQFVICVKLCAIPLSYSIEILIQPSPGLIEYGHSPIIFTHVTVVWICGYYIIVKLTVKICHFMNDPERVLFSYNISSHKSWHYLYVSHEYVIQKSVYEFLFQAKADNNNSRQSFMEHLIKPNVCHPCHAKHVNSDTTHLIRIWRLPDFRWTIYMKQQCMQLVGVS